MESTQRQLAEECKQAAEDNTMDFPSIVGKLIEAGFERYEVDYCRAAVTYYLPDGDSVTLDAAPVATPIPAQFDAMAVQAAVREAQMQVEGYTYKGFCRKVMAAGCAGYIVSFLGRRVVYFGRTAETHVEHFPK